MRASGQAESGPLSSAAPAENGRAAVPGDRMAPMVLAEAEAPMVRIRITVDFGSTDGRTGGFKSCPQETGAPGFAYKQFQQKSSRSVYPSGCSLKEARYDATSIVCRNAAFAENMENSARGNAEKKNLDDKSELCGIV